MHCFLLTSIFHTFNLLIYCLYLRFLLNILCTKQTICVSRIIHDDLGLKCLKKRRAQELTEANRAVRLKKKKKLTICVQILYTKL